MEWPGKTFLFESVTEVPFAHLISQPHWQLELLELLGGPELLELLAGPELLELLAGPELLELLPGPELLPLLELLDPPELLPLLELLAGREPLLLLELLLGMPLLPCSKPAQGMFARAPNVIKAGCRPPWGALNTHYPAVHRIRSGQPRVRPRFACRSIVG